MLESNADLVQGIARSTVIAMRVAFVMQASVYRAGLGTRLEQRASLELLRMGLN